ncbi:hypothetical protein [Xylanimonas ulmi]|uniref:Lipoprotein n=1 Tax=Xylanimonas ulmi TaxID=228973 RepID=A0A4Q7M0G1_9MICO|nr:hypothetical protein [Xylanibacterium ulmi]RZS60353.1 hypothetical protein EV386_0608 [Xylanibacterium ulmi]
MRLAKGAVCVGAVALVVAVVVGCSGHSTGAASCAAPEVTAPTAAPAGGVVEVSVRHLFADCNDTGQTDFVARPLTGVIPKVIVDGVEHTFDHVEPLDADDDGTLSLGLALPDDVAAGTSVVIEVAGGRSAPITVGP